MHFHKQPYPSNFEFVGKARPGTAVRLGESSMNLRVEELADDVYRVTVASALWTVNKSQAGLTPPPARRRGAGTTALKIRPDWGLELRDAAGDLLLASPAGGAFGLCGRASLFMFSRDLDCQFYGMGEKWLGLELSGQRTKFWNTDVWGDFPGDVCRNGRPDPLYVSIPYVIIKRGNQYLGLLLNNPYATFVSTAGSPAIANQLQLADDQKNLFWIGAEDGRPELYILTGPSLPELTRKLQKLVGTTPMPPAWALGYHQCRWGYKSADDLERLDANFRRHEIPCDGLWLDIDYMNGYRVFTVSDTHFPELRKTLKGLEARGRKVVPILDPGVKAEKGYKVYDDGHKADVFCKNPQGREFIGLVWPGETVFPDYSTTTGRAWWAKQVNAFAQNGFQGAWLDMNDPSTGSSEVMHMLFDHGREPHESYHSQYALGMAQASRDGFLAARPDQRPFLLCRSGFIGSSKYTAIWTGDNYSNYHHLKTSISCTLNLALSGIPFNGPDIGGFGGSTNRQLLADWMKACFLFPFCRNHCDLNGIHQEPWVFGLETMEQLRHYIRLRYKLRPYLYDLFAAQEETGEAILRPLFYDFPDTPELPLAHVDDQFMAGPWIMQAPFMTENAKDRAVVLPAGRWYAAHQAAWVDGGCRETVKAEFLKTPLYVREGAILPMAAGEMKDDNRYDGRKVEFHLFLTPEFKGETAMDHVFDDGESFDYQRGKRSKVRVAAKVVRGVLEITLEHRVRGFGECEPSFVIYGAFKKVRINGRVAKLKSAAWLFAGAEQPVQTVV